MRVKNPDTVFHLQIFYLLIETILKTAAELVLQKLFIVYTFINDLATDNIQLLKIKNVGKLYFMCWKQLQKEKKE